MSPRFRTYLGLLCLAALAVLAGAAASYDLAPANPFVLLGFAGLVVVSERAVLMFHRTEGRVGFSLSEAVLLTMLTGLSWAEVAVAVAIGWTVIGFFHRRLGAVKFVFNVATQTIAAAAAAGVTAWVAGMAPNPVVRLGGAAVGALVFAAATHLFVAGAIALTSEERRFLEEARRVPRASVVSLGLGVLVGLNMGAAYMATPWMLVVFPVALGVISLSFQAIVHQANERKRLEGLHLAGRALSAPGLDDALIGFLRSIAATVSARGATLLLKRGEALVRYSVFDEGVQTFGEPVSDGPYLELMGSFDDDQSPLIDDGDPVQGPVAELRRALEVPNLIAAPLPEAAEVSGCVLVTHRSEAAGFDEADARLVEALANELTLSLESRRAFDEAEAERERFGLLVGSVKDYAIYMIDTRGVVVSWNLGAERILRCTSDEIIGKHFSIFYPVEERELWMQELAVARKEGRHEIEGWRQRYDGTRFLANIVVTPVLDRAGDLRGFAEVVRDITERTQAEQERASLESQLHQVQKLESVGQLAGGIAHDFNNILAVIANCSGFVLDALERLPLEGDDLEIVADVKEIRQAADRARALTRQLLIFSRRDPTEARILDLNDVIDNVKKLIRRAVGENVAMQIDLSPELPPITADAGQLEQVLLNLAINARDAMNGRGSLLIQTDKVEVDETLAGRFVDLSPGTYVKLKVTDTGCGMTPDVIEKAFDPFFTTKPKGQGTGLGLATVYGIVRRSGGHIEIHSSPGTGTSFLIFLPATTEQAAVVAEEAQAPVPEGAGQRVLLVEDEDTVRAVSRRILTQAGYEVVEAATATEALTLVLEGGLVPEVVVTDIVMPGLSGIEMAEELRVVHPRLGFVFMTGYSEAANSFPDALGPRSVLLHKPFDRDELLRAVAEMLPSLAR